MNKAKASTRRTELEDELARQVKLAKLPKPEREYKAIPERRFKWDFYWSSSAFTATNPGRGLLVEVQGAIWVKGGHSTGVGITRDMEKLNLATLNGFYSMNFSKEHIQSGYALKMLQLFITGEYK